METEIIKMNAEDEARQKSLLQRSKLEREAAGMSDDQIRYQVQAHERHNDHSWTFDVFVAEYSARGLREHGDWQDAGELRAGA